MKLEFLEGANEGESFVFIDDKPVKQEIIDRFNQAGHYVGERPTGIMGKLIVNLYKVSFDLIDQFNDHVSGIKMTDIDDPDSYVELALIPSKVHKWDGKIEEDFYISERLTDRMYARPSKKYLEKIRDENRNWGKQVLDDEQSN